MVLVFDKGKQNNLDILFLELKIPLSECWALVLMNWHVWNNNFETVFDISKILFSLILLQITLYIYLAVLHQVRHFVLANF